MLAFLLTMALAPDAPPPSRLAPVSAVAPAQNSLTLGVEMASLLNDAESTSRQMVKVFDETMPSVFAANPDLAELEVEYPGIIKRMIEAMRPEIERQVIDGLPVLWDRMAAVYAGALTDPEMREMLAFYRSPTGQWLIESIGEGADFSKLMKNLIENEDASITSGDLKATVTDSVERDLKRTMTKERERDILRMYATPAGRKTVALNSRLLEIGAAWSNESTPEEDARLNEIVEGVIAEFMNASENKTSRQSS
jgi:hypothetical protein